MQLFCPDALRSLLRNMHLLAGQRKVNRAVVLCGHAPELLATGLLGLEPSLASRISIAHHWKDLPQLSGIDADAVIVSQARDRHFFVMLVVKLRNTPIVFFADLP